MSTTTETKTTINERFVFRDRKTGEYVHSRFDYWCNDADAARAYKSKKSAEKAALRYMRTKNFSLREIEIVHSRTKKVTTTTKEITVEVAPTVVAFFDESFTPEFG